MSDFLNSALSVLRDGITVLKGLGLPISAIGIPRGGVAIFSRAFLFLQESLGVG